jgi:hypothetical protein
MPFRAHLLIAGLLLAHATSARAAVRFVVHPEAAFSNVPTAPYDSPATAAFTVGEAMAASSAGDTIKVAGIADPSVRYRESITLSAGVVLFGGYALDGAPFATRDPDSITSVLDGQSLASVVSVEPGAGRSTVIDGFVIREGFAGRGGGLLAIQASPTIRGNIFYLNATNNPVQGGGGAIRLEDGSTALIDGNTFIRNTSQATSGTIQVVNSSPEISNNVLFQDLAGVGVQVDGSSSPSIRFNDFFGNFSGRVRGEAAPSESALVANENIFVDPLICDIDANRFTIFDESRLIGAGEGGRTIGATEPACHARVKFVSPGGSNTYPYSTPNGAAASLGQVLAQQLTAPGDTIRVAAGDYGESITVPPGVVIEGSWNVIFNARRVGGSASVLGDTLVGGSIVTFEPDGGLGAVLDGFVVTGGSAPIGSAIRITGASPTLRSLSVLLNENAGGSGGVIHVDGGSPEIVNTLVALNAGSGLSCAGGASPSVHHCGFFGNTGGATSGCPGSLPSSVLTADPLFCDAESCTAAPGGVTCTYPSGDFHIFAESPYRDAGDDGGLVGALPTACNRVIHYVSPSGGNRFPYVSPADAAARIGDAVLVATPGDVVRVAAGSYSEVLQLRNGVRVEGGWSADFAQRAPSTSITTIEGNVAGTATVIAQGQEIDDGAVLSGFTITHAAGVDGPGIEVRDSAAPLVERNLVRGNTTSRDAAGILVEGGSPQIINCTVYRNRTTSTFAGRAGGILMRDTDPLRTISVTRNIFYDNDGGFGMSCDGTVDIAGVSGNLALANEGVVEVGGDPDISGAACPNLVGQNSRQDPLFCDYAAGDLSVCSNSPARISQCGDETIGARGIGCICTAHTFYVRAGNSSELYPYAAPACAASSFSRVASLVRPGDTVLFSGGSYQEPIDIVPGVVYRGNYTVEFTQRTFTTNLTGERRRRVLFVPPGADTTTVIDGFTLTNGRAERGGGLFVSSGSSPIVTNIRFEANVADTAGACLYCAPGSAPRVRYAFFSRNRNPVPLSSIVALDNSSAEISNCTLYDNLTVGIDILSGSPKVFNNLLARNDRGGIRCGPGATPDLGQNDAFNNDDFNYFGCSDSVLSHNMEVDPLFCDEPARVLSIFDHSPAAQGRGGLALGSLGIGCTTNEHFVSSAGKGVYPYTTPLEATPSLREAIELAARRSGRTIPFTPGIGERDTVFIAGGVYNEDIDIPGSIVLLGGFAPDFGASEGRGFDPQNRDPIANPVIVRGSGTRSVAIVDSGGDIRSPQIDGLSFRGGRADYGGGLFFRSGAGGTIRNCSVDSSTATIGGGGVYLSYSQRTVDFNFFSAYRDSAPLGAAVYSDADSVRAEFRNCTFVENAAGPGGGAVEFASFTGRLGEQSLQRNLFADNSGIGLKIDRSVRSASIAANLFWQNVPADTMLPVALSATGLAANRFGDPRFCDPGAGDFSIFYKSPAVLLPCARPLLRETIGRFPVGCTDPGHVFHARAANAGQYPYAGGPCAAGTIGQILERTQTADTVRVAGGLMYRENLRLQDRIHMTGGWDNNFTFRDPTGAPSLVRPPAASTGGSILHIESPKDDAGTVIAELEIDSTTVVDGFTFEGGDAALDNGGAILCIDASPKITNNIFLGNETQNFGGALCVIRSRNQVIRGNRFLENVAGHGGGLYLGDCENPQVTENVFFANRSVVRGAGIRLARHSGAARLHDNTVVSNKGDGISFAGGSAEAEIYNNVIAFNTGAGLEHYPAPPGELAPATDHNLHWGNQKGNFISTDRGEGDIFLDPLFCRTGTADPLTNDFRVQACSPAIGAGRDSTDRVLGFQGNSGPFCSDIVKPVISIAFLKNSIVPRILDVYVTFSEVVVDSTLSAFRACENQPSTQLPLTRTDSTSNVYGVQGIETSGCGTLEITVLASDACNNGTTFSRAVSTVVVSPGASAVVQSPDGLVRLDVAASDLARASLVLLATAPTSPATGADDPALVALGRPVGDVYEVAGAADLAGDGVSMTFALPSGVSDAEAAGVAVYRRLHSGWVRVESWRDPSGRAVIARPQDDGLFRLVATGDAGASPVLPSRPALLASYPNPAPGAAHFAFDLPARGRAALRIYDASGRRVTTLVDSTLPAGRHAFGWSGTDAAGRRVPSGVYFYELTAGSDVETRKLVLVR